MKTKNDTVFLTHIFANEERLRRDTTIVLKNGKGIFKGNRVLPKGLYWIVNDKRKIFQILIGDNQKFGIEVDTTDIVNNIRFTSSPDNDIFYDFMRDDIQRQRLQHQLREQHQNAVDDAEKRQIAEQWQESAKGRGEYIKKLVNENEGLYVSKFLKMLLPLEIPDYPRDEEGRITDSTYVYHWYRAHYFDNFDVFDPDMLRTPMYEKQLTDYMTWFTRTHPVDTVCAEMDRMLAKVLHNKELFRCMLVSMFNFFRQNEQLAARDNYWVHLVDYWFVPHADWSNVDDMKKEADKVRHTLVGKLAPPLDELLVLPDEHFRHAALDTAIKNNVLAGYREAIVPDFRKSIDSKFLVLLFWDVNCGGCREKIQQVWKLYETCSDMGLSVITIQTLHTKAGKARWIDFVNNNDMFGSGWYNAWIISDQNWRELYDTAVVPKLYVLNEKKEIMFKGSLDLEWLQTFIETMAK